MTNPIFDTYKPSGFHTVTSYILAKEPEVLMNFLVAAFYAVKLHESKDSAGVVNNIILQIGDSCFKIGKSDEPTPAQFVLYVDDPDAMQAHATDNGAVEIMKVEDRDYGDRQGGVEDISGNKWWITKRLISKAY